MRLSTIMNFLFLHLKGMRSSRLKTLAALVFSLLKGRVASVTALGRHLPGEAQVKHAIKRADRFLANEAISFLDVTPLLLALIPSNDPLLLIIDWTVHKGHLFQTLSAQVPIDGRCVPLHARTYRLKGLDQSTAESQFLEELSALMGHRKDVILLTDRGFGRPFREHILRHGWDLVSRLPGQLCFWNGSGWQSTGKVRLLPGEVRDWGLTKVGKWRNQPERLRVVGYQGLKGPKRKRPLNRQKDHNVDAKYRRQAKSPWVLVTTLEGCRAEEIVQLYSQRFQIEESFRDWKNHRFAGYHLNEVKCSQAGRLERLLVVVAVAYVIQVAHGLVARGRGWEGQFRVNRSAVRQIGAFVVGGLMLEKGKICNWATLKKAVREAAEHVWEILKTPLDTGPLPVFFQEAA